MANNRRPQAAKPRGKKTDPFKAERRIRGANSPRAPKHRNKGWGHDD